LTRCFDFGIPRFMKTRRRKPASIAKTRWVAYATAGAASAVTCVDSAQATIHYSGLINRTLHYDYRTFRLDQTGAYFYLDHTPHYYSTYSIRGASADFGIGALAGASFAGFYTCAYNPEVASISNLDRGEVISAKPFVPGGRGILFSADGWSCGGGNRGQFRGEEIAFIGFKFNNGNGDHYGWARIKTGGPDSAYKLMDCAYGDVGDRVRAGQRSSNDMATDKGSLGWLALGAAGLLAWRKRRGQVTE
jgi:hypothetical protein